MYQRTISLVIVLGSLLAAGAALANEELAKKHQCMSCHLIDKKIVGPAYLDIAVKHKGEKEAQRKETEARLIEKIKKGGSGVWGNVPMPPNSAVKDEDIKTLVKWILSLKAK